MRLTTDHTPVRQDKLPSQPQRSPENKSLPVTEQQPSTPAPDQEPSAEKIVTPLQAEHEAVEANFSTSGNTQLAAAPKPIPIHACSKIGRSNPHPNLTPIYLNRNVGTNAGIVSTPPQPGAVAYYRLSAVYDFHRAPDAPDLTFVITPPTKRPQIMRPRLKLS
jgi:hypothetical protein